MEYESISSGIFLRRPNRFVAEIEINGVIKRCHVKNTGRCKELLVPGAKVYVNGSSNPHRSTQYDLVSVWKGQRLINIDSQAPNKSFGEYLRQGKYVKDIAWVKPEAKYGSSRFDFAFETAGSKAFAEVKGVTLEEGNAALFPDAPTQRGVKHLRELARCVADGYDAHAIFVIQMQGVSYFTPNAAMHPAFSEALEDAVRAGVKACAFDCVISENTMTIGNPVPIRLANQHRFEC